MLDDQPVDFSTSRSGENNITAAPRYSILGSYLKAPGGGRSSSTTPPEVMDAAGYEMRRAELAEDLRRAGYGNPWLSQLEAQLGGGGGGPRPASRDSRGDSREDRNSSGEDIESK